MSYPLSNRLKTILSFVEESKGFLDVGADHALIPLSLCEKGFNGKIYASEVAKGPYEGMVKSIGSHLDKITPLYGDGLSVYKKGIDQVLMAGMGGITIGNILIEGASKLDGVLILIIEPQSNVYQGLSSALNKGFKEDRCIYIEEKNKIYPLIRLVKGHEEEDETEMTFSKYALDHKDPFLYKYLSSQINILNKVMSGLKEDEKEEVKSKLSVFEKGMARWTEKD